MKINTQRLVELLGSEEAAQRFVQMFLEKLPEQTSILKNAMDMKDWETASNLAHTIKSQCRYLGLDQLADELQLLENNPASAERSTAILEQLNGLA
ncbi:MAG: Hpt domain-containing protein [Saprospiraceae bacterium]|nr:Hpt domain-containing protein [Saprospiraceae bacterium]